MARFLKIFAAILLVSTLASVKEARAQVRIVHNFNKVWHFIHGDSGRQIPLATAPWRTVNVPHDWSIEGNFSKDHPAGPAGGALPGGVGWYRKSFEVPSAWQDKKIWIEFDGVYRNSEVWCNENYLGKRPYGYGSFRYDISKYVHVGMPNEIVVRVDNSQQPNSRWYSGSGIYRNVRLVITEKIHVAPWGIFITTPSVDEKKALIRQQTILVNETQRPQNVQVTVELLSPTKTVLASKRISRLLRSSSEDTLTLEMTLEQPQLWSVEQPVLYSTRTSIASDQKVWDDVQTSFGIRYFSFDVEKGFFLNGKHVKINGVCNHHDLGCLGSAVSLPALKRQLRLLKAMGCNAIRTSHNPPAPELLDLCDTMGFLVMDEAFDMWKKGKTKYDFSLDWDEWYERELRDMILRDRNHPSVIIWSIGNEVIEQWDEKDSLGVILTQQLTRIVKELDTTRPVTAACNNTNPKNPLFKAGVLDLIGFNYGHKEFPSVPHNFPGKAFIATETVSALATRGHYDMPSDSIRRWPLRWDLPLLTGNPDNTCSSYDNCSAPWGSTHEETWDVVKAHDFIAGQFIWTGFDYLGEPTPYDWPSRSSYFGILDLAGFPKDAYYFYQSEWTTNPVLHIFPHWNWKRGDTVDVWAYTNCDEVELFINGVSVGVCKKTDSLLHLQWRVPYEPGEVKAVGRKGETTLCTASVKTAGEPRKILLEADRTTLKADGDDMAFLTARIVDEAGTLVPYANSLITFEVDGEADIVAMDNGCQTSVEPFQTRTRSAFHGLCLGVLRTREGKTGTVTVRARAEGLETGSIQLLSEQ